MTTITNVEAWEVLDSRGNPTIAVSVEAGNVDGRFLVPAGASTGQYEAVERRDGGDRYRGRGVRDAVHSVREDLEPVINGMEVTDQTAIDTALVECDGTDTLSRLGANAVLGVSGAVAHAASAALDRPLYETVADDGPGALPVPMVNILSGGLHAEGGIEIQDFLVVPLGRDSIADAIHDVWAVRQAVRDRILDAGHRPLVADEGGFAPPLDDIETAFELLAAAIKDAGFSPNRNDVGIAIDVAATHFYDSGEKTYQFDSLDMTLSPDEMVEVVSTWIDDHPIVSVEDPLDETDWSHWQALADRVGDRVQLLGDDLIVTDKERLEQAIETAAANAVLVKPNQAGTLTRAVNVTQRAQSGAAAPVVSARSGETCDATIVDLAVGLDVGQIKIGSLARSERLAKYNRLLELETCYDVPYASDNVLAPR